MEIQIYLIQFEQRLRIQRYSDATIRNSDLTGFENLLGLGRVYINDSQYFDNVSRPNGYAIQSTKFRTRSTGFVIPSECIIRICNPPLLLLTQ